MNPSKRISIVGWGSASALGHNAEDIWQAYSLPNTAINHHEGDWVARLPSSTEARLQALSQQEKGYQRLDRSVLLAMLAGEQALKQSGWAQQKIECGLYLGSSRGATGSWEAYFQQFLDQKERLSPQSSPLTTAGNLATHTAQHLGLYGFTSDNSITCSTALHALANAVVWLESGRYKHFLAGGTEAPLTPFTLAQMNALKIYAQLSDTPYPSRSLDLNKTDNTMVLGEGSALFALEADATNPLAQIAGLGYAREDTATLTAVSKNGLALQKAMRQALSETKLKTVDVVICHSPGTRLGDLSEWRAIRSVFGENMPSLTSNKWKLGHTLGASGGLSLELALLLLEHQTFVPIPYLTPTTPPKNIRSIMVNALGFGGNAISLIITKP
ncbi:beta-ketoacyl synthase N-terminal-like domain-containing protein [Lewinella sp. LCG006]|uniref:beta-ketoacyl synthase N-terminal-like domain-containing protein n=1 Tax=Lewinella sp. LCG006 TaxID=3231911 RepID=UPI0034600DC5